MTSEKFNQLGFEEQYKLITNKGTHLITTTKTKYERNFYLLGKSIVELRNRIDKSDSSIHISDKDTSTAVWNAINDIKDLEQKLGKFLTLSPRQQKKFVGEIRKRKK